MSVTSFKEIHRGRAASFTLSDSGEAKDIYVRVFLALTDSQYDDGETVKSHIDCPKRADVFPNNVYAYCKNIDARNLDESKKAWHVTCRYDTGRQWTDNPLNDPADISWDAEQFQRPAYKDKDGDAILNSANDYYDPLPRRDDSRWAVTVRKNLAAVPSWILNYQDAINSSSFWLDGLFVLTRKAKMQKVGVSSWQHRDGIPFRIVTMLIHVAKDGFSLEILDQGFHYLDGSDKKHILDDEGVEVTTPALLDGSGAVLSSPSPSTAVFNTHNVYDELDFRALPLV
jgi:hypothetical protein